MVWSGANLVYGVQFTTSMGRVSPRYGGDDGIPTAAKSRGGVLGGLASIVHWDKDKKKSILVQFEVSGLWS